jgi:hypothetical protein
MSISKSLTLAIQNWQKFDRLYAAIKKSPDLKHSGLNEEEINKLNILVSFIDERLDELIGVPIRKLRDQLKKNNVHRRGVSNDRSISWEGNWVIVWCRPIKSNKAAVYFCAELIQMKDSAGELVILLSISFEKLDEIEQFTKQRNLIEKKLVKILDSNWLTSQEFPNDFLNNHPDCGFSPKDLLNDYAEGGGCVYFKELIPALSRWFF